MTIAFSTKSNKWTTRYSFEPKHYFTVDQQLVSFKNSSAYDAIIWAHDQGGVYNKFYGTNYPSSFTVVSNHDPSATKQYESFSIEDRNWGGWNVEFESSSGTTASTSTLSQSENDFYAEIPRSNMFKDGRLVFIGTADSSQMSQSIIESGSIKMKTVEDVAAKGPLVYPRGSTNVLTCLLLDNVSGFQSPGIQSDTSKFVKVKSVDPKTKTLNLDLSDYTFNPAFVSSLDPSSDSVPLFVLDLSSGESMRGDWVRVKFETNAISPEIEVYAVNFDQHNVNLDHSLGQNN